MSRANGKAATAPPLSERIKAAEADVERAAVARGEALDVIRALEAEARQREAAALRSWAAGHADEHRTLWREADDARTAATAAAFRGDLAEALTEWGAWRRHMIRANARWSRIRQIAGRAGIRVPAGRAWTGRGPGTSAEAFADFLHRILVRQAEQLAVEARREVDADLAEAVGRTDVEDVAGLVEPVATFRLVCPVDNPVGYTDLPPFEPMHGPVRLTSGTKVTPDAEGIVQAWAEAIAAELRADPRAVEVGSDADRDYLRLMAGADHGA